MSVSFDFTGKKVFITGGSNGIGESLVETFANAGAHVVFTFHSGAERAEQICNRYRVADADVEQTQQRVTALQLDLGDAKAVEPCATAAIERMGGIDIGSFSFMI